MKNDLDGNPKIKKTEEEIINEALFGIDEEIESETAEDILASYEINTEDLVTGFKLLIQQEIRENYGIEEKVTESENLLHTLTDISNYERTNDTKNIEPKTLIQGFLDGTILPKLKPSWDFRNKTKDGLSENDKQILKDLESELDEE